MPYARVGAMPLPSQNNAKNKKKVSSSRKQGITMEDLKKQTAIRLANEQHLSTPYNNDVRQPSGREMGAMSPYHELQSYPSPSYGHDSQPQYPNPNRTTYTNNDPYGGRIGYGLQGHAPNTGVVRPQQPQSRGVEVGYQGEGRRSPYSHNSVSSGGSASPFAARQEVTTQQRKESLNSSKSKLPHGLTVQELKEMTKARLQNEAHEPSDGENAPPGGVQTQASLGPQDSFGQAPSPPQRSFGSGSLQSSGSRLSAPAAQTLQKTQSAPPGFQSLPSSNSLGSGMHPDPGASLSRESWTQQSSKAEAWENASATSMNSGSDYYGSESPAFSGAGQPTDDFNEVSFSRSRSYPAGPGPNDFENASSLGSSSSFYGAEGSFAGNRRRACTLSPRAGLSHLHEDRPLITGFSELSMPSFDSVRAPLGFRRSGSDPNDNLRGRTYSGGAAPNEMLLSGTYNRARTSSAPALFSSPGELLSPGEKNPFGRITDDQGLPLSQSVPTSVMESVLGLETAKPESDFSSVFRSCGDGGLLGSLESVGSGVLTGAATWGNSSSEIASSRTVGDETGLAEGLNSMLSLSSPSLSDSLGRRRESEASFLPSFRDQTSSSAPSELFSTQGQMLGNASLYQSGGQRRRDLDGPRGF
eukprot:CAMPEP_0194026076 /NCGR_PEP_ID=MMETSP0009_2-20130614/386_1 /TAXON_ID=210454 /ORGANISM="Grammatophora oceanica, Strain CCMP 410" /LENGTH=640 /DNA_ID=CAMNT_0038664583 /DNA_START=41 /DNA_END=1963 /DNA_ORIENTATION=+